MARTFLIDGYNLIHALGYLTGQQGPHVLERARLRLLHFLLETLAEQAARTTVVFDASRTPRRSHPRVLFKEIEVRFAQGQDEADDLIEQLIRAHPAPRDYLHVISSDHRLLSAARRSAAVGWSCAEFLDHLDAERRQHPAVPSALPEKVERLSAEETAHWLRAFGDLADDPGFKELFDPYPFDEQK
jgi:predicted RNA-binding protein with PIN domain